MSDEDGLRESGMDAATCQSSGRGEEMEEKDHEIAHTHIVARNWATETLHTSTTNTQ